MTPRDICNEVLAGLQEIKAFEAGWKTLRTYRTAPKPLREKLGVSRGAFANQLHVSPRTLENWEQGRAKPNDQAKALILLVAKHPDTLARLEAI